MEINKQDFYPIIEAFQFFYEVIEIIKENIDKKEPDINTININLMGGRLSAKTYSAMRFVIEASFTNLNIKTNIVRNEVNGATQTWKELNGIVVDLYGLFPKVNSTTRTMLLNNNNIEVIGILSNRKKQQHKLGLARLGIKKQIQINLFDEITEIDTEKTVELVKQATGGAKITINIYIANPWISSMWYVKKFVMKRLFIVDKLKTIGEHSLVEQENKTLNIWHTSNHRINTKLSEGQHASITSLWKQADYIFASVADLGLPGIAEGLIYAPIMNRLQMPQPLERYYEVEIIQGGLDWGTATGPNASSVALTLGKIARDYRYIQIERVYKHSNKIEYKTDNDIYNEVLKEIIAYCELNREIVIRKNGIIIYYDNAAHGIGSALTNMLNAYYKHWSSYIEFRKCTKYEVPVRIDIVKHLITSNRFHIDKAKCLALIEEMEQSQWEETRLVNGRATRVKSNDDCLDSMEYMINQELMDLVDSNYLELNKWLRSKM